MAKWQSGTAARWQCKWWQRGSLNGGNVVVWQGGSSVVWQGGPTAGKKEKIEQGKAKEGPQKRGPELEKRSEPKAREGRQARPQARGPPRLAAGLLWISLIALQPNGLPSLISLISLVLNHPGIASGIIPGYHPDSSRIIIQNQTGIAPRSPRDDFSKIKQTLGKKSFRAGEQLLEAKSVKFQNSWDLSLPQSDWF